MYITNNLFQMYETRVCPILNIHQIVKLRTNVYDHRQGDINDMLFKW